MKAVYRYYRVPELLEAGRRGRPRADDLFPFPRGNGQKPAWRPAPRGGAAECDLLDDDGKLLSTGRAECSLADAFCYRIGRDIARGRAWKKLEEALWNHIFPTGANSPSGN